MLSLESYLWGVKLQTYHSELNGTLELWLIDNHKVLNTAHATQSFDSMHRIFRKAFAHAGIARHPIQKALLLGLACGSVPEIIFEELKLQCRLIAVDHDPVMLQVAHEHFNIRRFSNMEVVVEDALHFTNHCMEKFDLLIVDLFNDNEVPDVFLGAHFLGRISSLLNDKGILIFNMMTETPRQKEKFRQLHSSFPSAGAMKANGTNTLMIYKT